MIRSWLNPQMWNCGLRGPTMGLEHPKILVSEEGPGTSPQGIAKDNSIPN